KVTIVLNDCPGFNSITDNGGRSPMGPTEIHLPARSRCSTLREWSTHASPLALFSSMTGTRPWLVTLAQSSTPRLTRSTRSITTSKPSCPSSQASAASATKITLRPNMVSILMGRIGCRCALPVLQIYILRVPHRCQRPSPEQPDSTGWLFCPSGCQECYPFHGGNSQPKNCRYSGGH